MGSFHRTRLSFMPTLLRRMEREDWRFERRLWDIDGKGVGRAVYTVHGPERSYSLVCFAHDLPDDQRSDRVIATAWDATFTLFDGIPGEADLERLAENVPKQEAGRITDSELSLSRANRSVRLFEYVVASLANGLQPDMDLLDDVGYLMRTTAVYGSGKFGAADREKIRHRPELRGPFQAEMLSVWLTRAFTVDLAEHLARARNPRAVTLTPRHRNRLGIGNSTGLGMAPFLINHPALINNWILARETALARVRSIETAEADDIAVFRSALANARIDATRGEVASVHQSIAIVDLRCDLHEIEFHLDESPVLEGRFPWNALYLWAEEDLSLEGQEALVSLLLETYADIVDDLADTMDADEDSVFRIDGSMTIGEVKNLVRQNYGWATAPVYELAENKARFWYVSEEKLEPRLGERYEEPGAELELPLAVGRDVSALDRSLQGWPDDDRISSFLLESPEHRHSVRRVQLSADCPYAEIRDNLIGDRMYPVNLLRCKLSFFGATHFDPRSDRWLRICMYQYAPYPEELLQPPDKTAA
jgi:hypothetical protein